MPIKKVELTPTSFLRRWAPPAESDGGVASPSHALKTVEVTSPSHPSKICGGGIPISLS